MFFFHKWSGQWASLCPFHAATGGATAMAIAEDPAQPEQVHVRVHGDRRGVEVRAQLGIPPVARRPGWFVYDDGSGRLGRADFALKPFYDACKIAARAAYCQDRQSFTKNGTLVDLFDTRQFIWPNAIENPFERLEPRFALDVRAGVLRLRRSARRAIRRCKARRCSARATASCPRSASAPTSRSSIAWSRTTSRTGAGRARSPSTPRIEVFSPNYCVHNEHETGAGVALGLQPVHDGGLQDPARSAAASTGRGAGLGRACVAEAQAVCKTSSGVRGRWVWPRDVTAAAAPPAKYLLGPGGAVERIDGSGTGGSSATVSGWACDPEWPGAAVSVAIYGGAPREQRGSELLGQAYADQALAAPLAREVSAACDGPVRDCARHGFSFTLPAEHVGQRVRLRARRRDRRRAGRAADAAAQRHRARADAARTASTTRATALTASCSACATPVCDEGPLGGCCTTAWTDACAAAAEACARRRRVGGRERPRVRRRCTTGWIEAPTTGAYVFEAAPQPSRLFVNGQKLRRLVGRPRGRPAAASISWPAAVPPALGSLPGVAARPRTRSAA